MQTPKDRAAPAPCRYQLRRHAELRDINLLAEGCSVNRGEGPSEPSYDMALLEREHSAVIRGSVAEHLHVLGENPHGSQTEANVIEARAVLTIGMGDGLERSEATDGSGPRTDMPARVLKRRDASNRLAMHARFVPRPRFCPEFTNLGVRSRAAQSSVTEFMHDAVHQVGL